MLASRPSPALPRPSLRRPRPAPVPAARRARSLVARASAEVEPDTALEAIELGTAKFKGGDAAGALALFQAAFELPGNGTLRDRKKPRELSAGEMQAAYYNMACAFSALGEEYYAEGLAALQASIKAGFDDFATLRNDPDLAGVRTAKDFEALMDLYEPKGLAKVFSRQAITQSALGRRLGWK